MKSKQAWETFDGKTFFDKKEAEGHEEKLRIKTAKESLATLLERSGFIPIEKARNLAQYMVSNVRLFATAISPLITKSTPRPQVGQVSRSLTPKCVHGERIHVVDGSSGHWECKSCGTDL